VPNTLSLRKVAAELGAFRDRLYDAGDMENAERLDELIERTRDLADTLDEALVRLGNPATDE
jgi:hypothetical protein